MPVMISLATHCLYLVFTVSLNISLRRLPGHRRGFYIPIQSSLLVRAMWLSTCSTNAKADQQKRRYEQQLAAQSSSKRTHIEFASSASTSTASASKQQYHKDRGKNLNPYHQPHFTAAQHYKFGTEATVSSLSSRSHY